VEFDVKAHLSITLSDTRLVNHPN